MKKKYKISLFIILTVVIIGIAICFINLIYSNSESESWSKINYGVDEKSLELKKSGELTVAVSPQYPPFEYSEDGKLCGFDIDIAKMISDSMGLKLNIVQVPYPDIIPCVQEGSFDIALSALRITNSRLQEVMFTKPYYIYSDLKVIIVVKQGCDINENNLEEMINRPDCTVSYMKDSIYDAYISKYCANSKKQTFSSDAECLNAVREGNATVCLVNEKSFNQNDNPDLNIVTKITEDDTIGAAISKQKINLLQALNNVIDKRWEDSSIDKLVDKYFSDF